MVQPIPIKSTMQQLQQANPKKLMMRFSGKKYGENREREGHILCCELLNISCAAV